MQKTYSGIRDGFSVRVTVTEEKGGVEHQRQLRRAVVASMIGPDWGYIGSGPRELATNLLLDFFGGDSVAYERATALAPQFEQAAVSRWPYHGWIFSAEDVADAVRRLECDPAAVVEFAQ